MPRYATIDVGTNAVLLLVADRQPDGRFQAVRERAEITRLGRGVDKRRRLSPEGMEDTLHVLSDFVSEARSLGAEALAVSATSAARDAENGAEFLSAAKQRAGVTVDIISGELEAQARVHGGTLLLVQLEALADKLCGLPLAERQKLPGLQPKREDVIPAGALILLEGLRALGLDRCLVSDRGLCWGLLAHRFGATHS
ncbi:Ppx/GppA phosphatase family protein [Archangium lansingense]|uniref:Ppx/GppA phosphatase N-terminal domain-containing protein n=1 Tax=Archangium lansingense TaxID=2995310 RepID=A0ABT4A3J3_9BACT|nr:hypothetical protein [Archangium lansinium]MCY1075844.1 hypothetical protein [Archangium lansinium]